MHVERVGKYAVRIRVSIPRAQWDLLEQLSPRLQADFDELLQLTVKAGATHLMDAAEKVDLGELAGGYPFILWSIHRFGKVGPMAVEPLIQPTPDLGGDEAGA